MSDYTKEKAEKAAAELEAVATGVKETVNDAVSFDPNLDYTAKKAASQGLVLGTDSNDAVPEANIPNEDPSSVLNFTERIRTDFKNILSDGQEVPEDLNNENYLQKLIEFTGPKIVESSVTPEALQFNKFLKDGGNKADYFKSIQEEVAIEKMSDDQVLFYDFKNQLGKTEERPDGFTDEEILERVEGMDTFDKKEKSLKVKSSLREQKEVSRKSLVDSQAHARTEDISTRRGKMLENVDSVISEKSKVTSILGVPVKPEDVAAYNVEFRELMTADENGVLPARQLLTDNKVIYDMLYHVTRQGGIEKFLTDEQNKRVNALKEKLSITPQARQSNQAGVKTVDYDKLAAPELR
jgi:hypothetical protein